MATLLGTTLADELEQVLSGEPLGLAGSELARRLGRRKSDVLAALARDARFAQTRKGPASRWVRVREPEVQLRQQRPQEPMEAVPASKPEPEKEASPKLAESLSGRCGNPTGHRAAMATWVDEAGIRRCVLCGDTGESKPLTWAEYTEGEGGEARTERFLDDLAALSEGRVTPEIRERLRHGLGKAVNT